MPKPQQQLITFRSHFEGGFGGSPVHPAGVGREGIPQQALHSHSKSPSVPRTKEPDNTDSLFIRKDSARPPAQVQHQPLSPLFPGVSGHISLHGYRLPRPRRFCFPQSSPLGAEGREALSLAGPPSRRPLGGSSKRFRSVPSRLGLETGTWKAGTSIPEAGRAPRAAAPGPRASTSARAAAEGPPRRPSPHPLARPAPPGLVPALDAPSSSAHSSPDRCRQLPKGHRRGRAREAYLSDNSPPTTASQRLRTSGQRTACMRKSRG